jgi:DNA-binding FadR family transcriptional regulator
VVNISRRLQPQQFDCGTGIIRTALVGNLGTQIATLIGRSIVTGELSPGSTLPTEAELCETYGVSRTTVREALKKLHGKGLIAGTARSGTRVLSTKLWNQFDVELLEWCLNSELSESLLQELHEIRICFEPEACRVAADHGHTEDHDRIRAALDAMSALRTDPPKLIEADLEFHMAIVDATHNRFFIALGTAVKTALRISFSLLQARPDMPVQELELHREIGAAVISGQGQKAANTMRELISLAAHNISVISTVAVRRDPRG